MFQINCLNPISKVGLDRLTADYKVTDNINDAEGVLVRSASMHELELPENLLAVARAGAGVNNIPLDKCAQKGIVVFNTPGANANGVKELVIAGMLLAARDVVGGIEWVKASKDNADIAKAAEKEKKKFAGTEVMGKKLGVIGLGAIGVKVANTAVSLDRQRKCTDGGCGQADSFPASWCGRASSPEEIRLYYHQSSLWRAFAG